MLVLLSLWLAFGDAGNSEETATETDIRKAEPTPPKRPRRER